MYLGLTKVKSARLEVSSVPPRVRTWSLPAPDVCPLSGCKLKTAGPIVVILNSLACNTIHKCADQRTYISRFAGPAHTWITLLRTYRLRRRGVDHWDAEACVCMRERTRFFAPLLLDIKGLYPISWLSQKSKTNKTLPPPSPPPIQSRRAEKQRHRKRKSTRTREAAVSIQASTRRDAEEKR